MDPIQDLYNQNNSHENKNMISPSKSNEKQLENSPLVEDTNIVAHLEYPHDKEKKNIENSYQEARIENLINTKESEYIFIKDIIDNLLDKPNSYNKNRIENKAIQDNFHGQLEFDRFQLIKNDNIDFKGENPNLKVFQEKEIEGDNQETIFKENPEEIKEKLSSLTDPNVNDQNLIKFSPPKSKTPLIYDDPKTEEFFKKENNLFSNSKKQSPIKKTEVEKDLVLDLSDIKTYNNSGFLLEKNDFSYKNSHPHLADEEDALEKPKVNLDEKLDNDIFKNEICHEKFLCENIVKTEIKNNSNIENKIKNEKNFKETDQKFEKIDFLNTKKIIKEEEEENNWGIEDFIDVKTDLDKPEIIVKHEDITKNNNNNFEMNIAKALDISKEMSFNNDNNFNLDLNSNSNINNKNEEVIFDELKFGKYETSNIINSIEKSDIKSSKGSYDKIVVQKKISEELAGINRINSFEGKKELLFESGNLTSAFSFKNNSKSNQNLVINKDLLHINKIFKSTNFLSNQGKPLLLDGGKKRKMT